MIGIITGSGLYDLPGLEKAETKSVETPYGQAGVVVGVLDGREVAFIARHGANHDYLSNLINHRANIYALRELGARAIVATSVMGVVDGSLELAHVLLFDDLYFPDNRLPGGESCTFFTEAGQPRRGHYMFGSPFSAAMASIALRAAGDIGISVVGGGTYGHVNGPRFNSKAEIRRLQVAGVTAISQTCGPEAVLAGELEIPYLLVGFGIDYANGVSREPTPIETLDRNLNLASKVMPELITGTVALLGPENIPFEGFVYRFE
ncbi:MAG: MTAP family purine nucleoside phosphorylase [Actinobacteria bacterium]|nr:MTAP family purine nucleoside phosphorylase [Actinomycetota bacterium]